MDMQLSIRDASRFMIGTAIIREMATKNSPDATITFDAVSTAALREGGDGKDLRASISKLADQEAGWFRSTPLHVLASDRVMQTRAHEMNAINSMQLAALSTLEFGAEASAGRPEAKEALQASLQAAVRAIDTMPGSTTERRGMLQALEGQSIEASGNASFISGELTTAQKVYLDAMMAERLAVYENPSHDRSDDLDMSP
jgi:hypothetical protein